MTSLHTSETNTYQIILHSQKTNPIRADKFHKRWNRAIRKNQKLKKTTVSKISREQKRLLNSERYQAIQIWGNHDFKTIIPLWKMRKRICTKRTLVQSNADWVVERGSMDSALHHKASRNTEQERCFVCYEGDYSFRASVGIANTWYYRNTIQIFMIGGRYDNL